jgi:hypothetical protein
MIPCASRLCLLPVLLMTASSAVAQQTIVYSKPSDVSADKANSFIGNSSRMGNAGDFRAPKQLFNVPAPNLPAPGPVYYQNHDPSVMEALNKQKNWRLLTPEEIIGVPTAAQIMGLPDPNRDSKLTLEQEFILRQTRQSAGATNSRAASLSANESSNPFYQNRENQLPFARSFGERPDDVSSDYPTRSWSQSNLKPAGNLPEDANQQDSAWTSVFFQPSQPKLTPEQLADRDRFRALMEPTPTPDATVKYSTPHTAPAPNPYLQPQPFVNPAGRSAVAVETDISRPTGIQPLPAATGSAVTTPKTRPAWQAQPPPWLTDKPQPHSVSRNY